MKIFHRKERKELKEGQKILVNRKEREERKE